MSRTDQNKLNLNVTNRHTGRLLTILLLFVLVLVVLVLPVSAASTVIFDDNFDSEVLGLNKTTLTNWSVTAGNVDVIGSIPYILYDNYPGNGNYLDLAGCYNSVIQSQSLSLDPGMYELSFEIASRAGTNTVNVQLGTVYNETFTQTYANTLTLITRQINVASAETATLQFSQLPVGVNDCNGTALDDVLLVKLDPGSKDECKDGGWEAFGFSNQGQCVRYIETGKDSRE